MHPSRVPPASHKAWPAVDVLKLFGTPTLTPAGSQRQEALQWQSHTALVALLACLPGWHSRESLAETVRPDAEPAVARAYLRRLLHRARALLPQVTALEVDATRVRWSGGSDVAAFDQAVARKDWQTAVALRRSPFLQGVGTTGQPALDDWFHETRARLAGSLQVALLALMTELYPSSDIDMSDLMQQLSENSPLDENCIQFLLLHARTPLEKHTAATAFHAFERRLEMELGATPGAQTLALYRELQGRIGFTQTPRPQTAAPDRITMDDELPDYGGHPLLGRQREMELLRDLVVTGEVRLLAIHGLGGIGKTRLARSLYDEVASDGTARVLWVGVEHLPTEHDLMSAIAARIGRPLPDHHVEAHLVRQLGTQKVILFLDGVEKHVSQVVGLLRMVDKVRDLRCVITSREAVRLPAEHLISLNGLDFRDPDSEASRLFQHHARGMGYLPQEADAAAISDLVAYLEGHPLAIEFAAAWAPLLPVRSILLELKKDLRFINAPSSQVAASRKDIHEIFEAEWARLDRAERSALGVLARHDGPLDLTTVCAVTDADGPRVLLRLVNKSLLRRSADGSLALHPLLRQFVRLKGQATG